MDLLFLAKITSLAIVLFLSLPAQMEACMPAEKGAASKCKTTRGEKCVFPFKDWNGRVHTECTWYYAFARPYRNGRAWCGTRKEAGWTSATWGDCGEGCTIPGDEMISHH